MKILVIGESCKDVFIYGKADRLEPSAPVPVFTKIRQIVNNGMASNTFANILSLCSKHKEIEGGGSLMGLSPQYEKLANVEIETNSNWEQITKTRFIDERTNYFFIRVDENDNTYGKLKVGDINFDEYVAIIISDYNKGFITEKDIEIISQRHPLVILDTKKPISVFAKKCKFIKINNNEYKNAKKITEDMREKLIVTLGKNGTWHNGIRFTVPEVKHKELSGSGDTFVAAFIYNFLQTKDANLAIEFANKCCTVNIQKNGVSTVTQEDVKKFDKTNEFFRLSDPEGRCLNS